jgi:CHAT domain-containing protein
VKYSRLYAVASLLFIFGCQSNSVSLKEAEQITAEFTGSSFTPPPRTIDDLSKHLSSPQISPTENLADNCRGIEKDSGRISMFKEYLTRYKPGDYIDTDKDPVGGWRFEYGWELYRGISISEIRRGNLEKAEKAQKQYLDVIPGDKRGAYIPGYSHLALIQLGRGDLSAAKSSIATASSWDQQLQRRPAHKIPIHDYWLNHARGAMATAKGELRTAEQYYRRALTNILEYKERAPEVAIIRSKLAEVIAAQGRLLEAENEARLAIKHSIEYDRVGFIINAPVIFRFAKVLIDQGRIKEAEKIAGNAVWAYQVQCSPADSVEFADARRILAETLSLQSRYVESLNIYESIGKSLGKETQKYQSRFGHDLTLAYALINQGKIQQASTQLESTVRYLNNNYGNNHPRSAEAKGFLAIAQWKSNNEALARQSFQESVRILQDPKNRTGVRPHNLRIIMESYLDMMSEQARNDADAANTMFVLANSLRSSTVQESISAMGARAAVGTPELAALLRKEQNARATIAALESTMSNALAAGVGVGRLKGDIEQLRKAQAAILNEITSRFPEYAELLNPAPLTLDKVKTLLTTDEAFITTYSSTDKTYVWTVAKDKPIHFSVSATGYQQLQRKVDRLRKAFAPTGASLASIPTFNVKISHEIFTQILKPSEHIWNDKGNLIVVAHGPLGHIPLSVLTTKKVSLPRKSRPLFSRYRDIPFLVKTHAIANLPSADALQTLRSLETPKTNREPLVAFGDPWFNAEQATAALAQATSKTSGIVTRGGMTFRSAPALSGLSSADISRLPRLSETADEIKDIANALGLKDTHSIYLGKRANESFVKSTNLSNYRVVAFATHGLIPGDLDGLTQPALALSAPEVSGVEGDGLLTMDEVMNLNLNADWVVLSACNTGSSDGAGAEAVSGLGRAFFYAGARSLLVSNWPVETNSARQLTTGVFKSGKSSSNRAEALKLSMLDIINEGVYKSPENGKTVYSYAHPIFWAPFSVIGD